MSLANVSIVGNLVKPPEQVYFPSGKVKTTLVVAVNVYGKPNRGGDTADFYKVETWGKLAELASQYLSKGNQVAVSGRLLFDRWTDKEGKNRCTPVVAAAQLSLPAKLKVADSQEDHLAEQGMAGGNVLTGTIACAAEEDSHTDAETNAIGTAGSNGTSSEISALLAVASGPAGVKSRKKLLQASAA